MFSASSLLNINGMIIKKLFLKNKQNAKLSMPGFFYSSLVLVSNTMRNLYLSIFKKKNQDCFICFFYFSNLRKTYFVNRF